MHYRQYYCNNADCEKQTYQYMLVGLFYSFLALILALNIQDLIPFFKFSRHFRNILTGVTAFATLICLIGYLICCMFRERIPVMKLEKMSLKAKWYAWQIRRLFNLKTIADILHFENKTRYGLALPVIEVYVNSSCNDGFVAIENMQNVANLGNSKMIQDLSGVLVGRNLQRFAFTSSELSQDGNFYIFYFEDVTTSQRLIINNNADFKKYICKNPSDLRLARNLIWHSASGNLSIIGNTRSGKTVFSSYLLNMMKIQGWKIYYYSVKGDIYVQKYHGESEPVKIVEALEKMVVIMHKRNAEIKKSGKTKYFEMNNMPNIAIVLDEISILNDYLSGSEKPIKELRERFNKAISAIVAGGLSSGIHFIGISQYGTKEGYLIPKARANVKDNSIILGLAADSADDRKYLMAGFDIPHRNYLTGQGLARLVSSGKMWEQPHFYETPVIKKYLKK